ncbi:MAG TPA: hypothetical protein EYH03_06490 [Chromatiales bacterium]|nr:hypothetical protein [Chromatiales bacterium]
MKTNISKITAACGLAMLSSTTWVQAGVEANIGVTSNYVWRGATQTDDSAAIQGGLDGSTDNGFYLGTWASNVDFGAGGEVEWDLYGGFSGYVGDFGYNIGLIYYAYPDSDDANFTEIVLSGSYGNFEAGINYTIASDVDDTPGAETFIEGDLYYHVSARFDLADGFNIGGTLGYYDYEDDGVGSTDLSYTHIQLDLGKSAGDLGDFTFSLSKADKEANGGDDDLKVFVSWDKTF